VTGSRQDRQGCGRGKRTDSGVPERAGQVNAREKSERYAFILRDYGASDPSKWSLLSESNERSMG